MYSLIFINRRDLNWTYAERRAVSNSFTLCPVLHEVACSMRKQRGNMGS